MMPVVRLNDATFADLSTLKDWFKTKTPSETIDRIVREAMDQLDMERDSEPEAQFAPTADGVMEFNSAPGLAFTKPMSASINGKAMPNPRWSSLLLTMIAQLKAKGLTGEKLVRELNVPSKSERYQKQGFKYYSDLGISLQGQSASDAWKEIDRIANKWKVPVVIDFCWRENDKAQFPGKFGRLRSGFDKSII
jgi:hypothetical protein